MEKNREEKKGTAGLGGVIDKHLCPPGQDTTIKPNTIRVIIFIIEPSIRHI